MKKRKEGKEISTFLRVADVAEMLDVCNKKVYNLIRQGLLQSYDFYGVKRVHREDLEKFIRKCQTDAVRLENCSKRR